MRVRRHERPGEAKTFQTRIDRTRARLRVSPSLWAREAGISRGQLLRYRSGEDVPRSNTLAILVRSLTTASGKPVNAADLYDLGEDEPLGTQTAAKRRSRVGKSFNSRLDQTLQRLGALPTPVADEAKVSRQVVGRLRAGRDFPRVTTIAKLVRALRRMGHDVSASDLFDVGETSS